MWLASGAGALTSDRADGGDWVTLTGVGAEEGSGEASPFVAEGLDDGVVPDAEPAELAGLPLVLVVVPLVAPVAGLRVGFDEVESRFMVAFAPAWPLCARVSVEPVPNEDRPSRGAFELLTLSEPALREPDCGEVSG